MKISLLSCAFALLCCAGCSTDGALHREVIIDSDYQRDDDKMALLAKVLSTHIKEFSSHRRKQDWIFGINLPDSVVQALKQTKDGAGLRLAGERSQEYSFRGSFLTVWMMSSKNGSLCSVSVDESDAPLSATTRCYSCVKIGKRWVITDVKVTTVA